MVREDSGGVCGVAEGVCVLGVGFHAVCGGFNERSAAFPGRFAEFPASCGELPASYADIRGRGISALAPVPAAPRRELWAFRACWIAERSWPMLVIDRRKLAG